MNNKATIEFGFRRISEEFCRSHRVLFTSAFASVDNTLLDLQNSSYPTQPHSIIKQLLDEVEHDIMNYQNRGLCYLLKPKAEADNTDTRF